MKTFGKCILALLGVAVLLFCIGKRPMKRSPTGSAVRINARRGSRKKRPAHRSGVRPAVRGALLGHLWYFPPWLMENAR